MTQHNAPLVGAHFRPPAKALLAVLPMGHPLRLVPEPTNPYDPNAIAVHLDSATLAPFMDELALSLPGYGTDPQSLDPSYHVGYVAKDRAAELIEPLCRIIASTNETAITVGQHPVGDWPATLSFSADGKYQVTFSL